MLSELPFYKHAFIDYKYILFNSKHSVVFINILLHYYIIYLPNRPWGEKSGSKERHLSTVNILNSINQSETSEFLLTSIEVSEIQAPSKYFDLKLHPFSSFLINSLVSFHLVKKCVNSSKKICFFCNKHK